MTPALTVLVRLFYSLPHRLCKAGHELYDCVSQESHLVTFCETKRDQNKYLTSTGYS